MKINKDFVSRNIAGDIILVPTGAASRKFNGMISLQGIGGFIWTCLGEGCDKETILNRIMAEYEVAEDVARADLDDFIGEMLKRGILEE